MLAIGIDLNAVGIIDLESIAISRTAFFSYNHVYYDTMSVVEAKRCFVFEVFESNLSTLHLAHLDIRLENICFNEECKPVLIGLDCSDVIMSTDLPYCKSCMISVHKPPEENDWMQLGWLIE